MEIATVLGIIVGLFVAFISFRLFFGDKQGFMECLRYSLTPDVLSWFRGEYGRDFWCELKLGGWIFVACISGIGIKETITILIHLVAK